MSVISNIPIVGSCFGLYRTASKVYNTTNPVDAIQTGLVGIFVECSPPVIKFPLLCTYLLGSAVVSASTCSPIAISNTVNAARLLIEA